MKESRILSFLKNRSKKYYQITDKVKKIHNEFEAKREKGKDNLTKVEKQELIKSVSLLGFLSVEADRVSIEIRTLLVFLNEKPENVEQEFWDGLQSISEKVEDTFIVGKKQIEYKNKEVKELMLSLLENRAEDENLEQQIEALFSQ